MEKRKKTKVLKMNLDKELSRVKLELQNISEEKPKKSGVKNEEEQEEIFQLPEIPEEDFNEAFFEPSISRRFTAPILLPSGQEKIDNLEEFASLAPSSPSESEEVSYSAGKKNYAGGDNLGYAAKADEYNPNRQYSGDNPQVQASPKITSSFIREDFVTGKRQEMQPAAGMDTSKTQSWEDRSRLEEFTKIQQYEMNKQQEENKSRKHRA